MSIVSRIGRVYGGKTATITWRSREHTGRVGTDGRNVAVVSATITITNPAGTVIEASQNMKYKSKGQLIFHWDTSGLGRGNYKVTIDYVTNLCGDGGRTEGLIEVLA